MEVAKEFMDEEDEETLKPSIKSVILIKNVGLSQIDCKTMKTRNYFLEKRNEKVKKQSRCH